MFVSGFVKLQVHVYASSICWRSRSSKCVRAQIFSRASLNTSKLSSGQSQTFFSPFSSLHLCLRSSTLTFSLNFCGLTSFSQAIITVVYLLNQTFLVGLSCFYVQACDVLVWSDQALECHSDSANAAFFLVQFLSGWTESGWESHSLYREAGCICSYGEFPGAASGLLATCLLSVCLCKKS